MDFYGILFDMKNGKKVPYSKNYFDTLFAAKLKEIGVKTLTGTLPLTFTTSETALRSWTIYGNNTQHNYSAEGTLPLTFTTHTAGAASDWEICGNDDNGTENMFDGYVEIGDWGISIGNPPVKYGNNARLRCNTMLSFPSIDTYTVAVFPSSYKISVAKCDSNGNSISDTGWSTNNYHTLTNIEKCVFIIKNARGTNISPSDIEGVCIVKGSTAPDHYIPYQQGVGEKTKNLLPFTNGTETRNNVSAVCTNGNYTITVGEGETVFTELVFNIPQVTFPISIDAGGMGILSLFNTAKQGISICFKNSGTIVQRFELNSENRVFNDYTDLGGATINQISFRVQANTAAGSLTVKPILTDDSTVPQTYIPYGYGIPISVNNTPQTFYIGDSPLTAGQSISKTSTGVDIELFEGANAITTTLYNKPSMSIEGVDYVGVGEPTNDGWQIPLTVSDGTNTATVNVPIEAPLTDGQSVSDTLTINTFEGENVLDTTLDNKPVMKIEYK